MNLKTRQIVFYSVYILLLLVPVFSLGQTITLNNFFTNKLVFLNVIQRWMGMTAFILIFSQIVIGSQMDKLVQIIGAQALRHHILEGISVWFLIMIHPLFEGTIVYEISGRIIDALSVYLPLFRNSREIYIAFGIITFILINTTVFAGYFRTMPFLRVNWRKFHILNYFAFYFLLLHARIGSDLTIFPFSWVYWIEAVSVSIIVVDKIVILFRHAAH